MDNILVKQYTDGEFRALLLKFQDAIDKHEYTEKIPYDTWRKLMRTTGTIWIEYSSPFVRIYYDATTHNGEEMPTIIYSAKTCDWGFGRFFYDYVIKEKHKMTNSEVIASLKACDAATSAATAVSTADYTDYTKADVTALEWKANYIQAGDINPILADKTYTYDNNNCDTTIAGKPLHELNVPSLDYLSYHQINGTWDSVASKSDMEDRFNKLEAELQKKVNKEELEKGKEEKTMKNFNFDFGSCAGNENIRMSMYGIAVKNNGGVWVSYNSQTKEIVDVDILNFEGSKYLYKMPVAIKDIVVGDVIVHNRVPMFVVGVSGDHKNLTVVDVRAGENKTIIPTTNMFGFNFCTKVVSLFNMGIPTADQPFGNMLPLLLMGENKDIDPMMMMFMMNQGEFDITSNPMMMYLMMKDNKNFDPMLMFMMMNQGQNHSCHCGKHNEKADN